MNKLSVMIIGLMAAGSMLAACQSDGYRIKGEAQILNDGDTLFVTDDFFTGTPIDTLIVKDGKFETEGDYAGETRLCFVYSPNPRGIYSAFFIEPGTINIKLSNKPEETSVKGTPTNNKWQEMSDSAMNIANSINSIGTYIDRNDLSHEEQEREIKKIRELHARFKALVTEYARKNTDNEFGYFLLTAYSDMAGSNGTDGLSEPDGLIDADTRLELIGKLPHKMQERPALKQTVAKLNQLKSTAEGNIMPDFTMEDINGKPVSALDEIKKNKVTVIDFWASWCGPCRMEMPNMVRMYNTYKANGLGIFGVSLDKNRSAWENTSKELGVIWPQVSDLKGWDNAAAQMFNVKSIPQTIVVDSNGKILKKGLRGEELEEFVKSLLK